MNQKIMDYIELNCIPIGSRAFRLHTEDSDFDFVMPKSKSDNLIKLLEKDKNFNLTIEDEYDVQCNNTPMENLAVLRFDMNNAKYEILIYEYDQYLCYIQINSLMRKILLDPINFNKLLDKERRINVYNNLMKAVFALNK